MAYTRLTDNVIYRLLNGEFKRVGDSKLSYPDAYERANFVITCDYGDWSGFRTLAECEAQFAELLANNKPDFWYEVVERL